VVGGSGFVKVAVGQENAKVQFVRTTSLGSEIADSYSINARR